MAKKISAALRRRIEKLIPPKMDFPIQVGLLEGDRYALGDPYGADFSTAETYSWPELKEMAKGRNVPYGVSPFLVYDCRHERQRALEKLARYWRYDLDPQNQFNIYGEGYTLQARDQIYDWIQDGADPDDPMFQKQCRDMRR